MIALVRPGQVAPGSAAVVAGAAGERCTLSYSCCLTASLRNDLFLGLVALPARSLEEKDRGNMLIRDIGCSGSDNEHFAEHPQSGEARPGEERVSELPLAEESGSLATRLKLENEARQFFSFCRRERSHSFLGCCL